MAKKPKSTKLTGTTVTLVRTRPKSIQPVDVVQQAKLGPQIGDGGSSVLHAFDPPLSTPAVAKIYLEEVRTDPKLDPFLKLASLVTRHDELAARLPFVLWPDELIFNRSDVNDQNARDALLGFTMPPLPENTVALHSFLKQAKYRKKPIDVQARLAARIADQLAKLHAAGIIFSDLNPKNFHITPDLSRCIFIDADGYQTTLKGNPVATRGVTEGYASPSAIANHTTDPTALRTPADDDFVLAILIFQLLVDRAHPFDTGAHYVAHPNATRNDNIAARRYAYANPALYHPEADTLAIYARLEPDLKAAFHRSFQTLWPTPAAEWTRLLLRHAAAPLAAAATPEPDPATWKAPPRPVAPASAAAKPGPASPPARPPAARRVPSRPLPPVIRAVPKSKALIVGLLALGALAYIGYVFEPPKVDQVAVNATPQWDTKTMRPIRTDERLAVADMLETLPASLAIVDEVRKGKAVVAEK